MVKRIISMLLVIVLTTTLLPAVPVMAADADGTEEISNAYLRVTVSRKNGGYVIATREGDILKKSDNDIDLTHRGKNMDTSFTSFRVSDAGGKAKDYIFGNDYGFLGLNTTAVQTQVDPKGQWIASSWSVSNLKIKQIITLENAEASEKLGTAHIAYEVTNNTDSPKEIKSRILMDTQLGDQDYGYYELPKQVEGQGVRTFSFEKSIFAGDGETLSMPADYFVRDELDGSQMVGFGINSANKSERPYRMTFAHWANIAATKFDYEPDSTLHFVNSINGKKTGDSAAALYYDLGSIAAGESKIFSTYYGVTANLRNKDNQVAINTTSPARMELTPDKQNYIGYTGAADGIAQVNVHLTGIGNNSKIRAVVYTRGLTAQKRNDKGSWISYTNDDPSYFDVENFGVGDERVNYFYFRFKPQERTQLGSFIIRVYNMDPAVNELGVYAEDYLLGSTENFVILPGTNKNLPAITLNKLEPAIVYNDEVRYFTITGQGMEFFQSELLEAIELRGENGRVYNVPLENISYEQTKPNEKPKSATFQINGYMIPGPYQVYFKWKEDTKESALNGVPTEFTSSAMMIHMSSDPKYRNDHYGVLAVVRTGGNKYGVVPYRSESLFESDRKNGRPLLTEDNLLMVLRGKLMQEHDNKNLYRLSSKNENVTINNILNYHGDDFQVEVDGNGSVQILMDGKLTSIGANTTVRNGTAAFLLKSGTEYIIPVYDERGENLRNGALSGKQDFLEVKWNNAADVLTTIGGFLIDLRFGVLGKIQDENGELADIISFGGSLDLSFVTPGAAAAARKNKDASDKWEIQEEEYVDDDPNGFGFGLNFNDETGEITTQTVEKEIPPKDKKAQDISVGADIHNVMFGGRDPGFVGINMEAQVELPHICGFLPQKLEAELGINTIGGYEVSFKGEAETLTMTMGMTLVIKSSPEGAPIPDTMFFKIGKIVPGFNVDGLGVFWVTGGGGGFENLYETIYGTDGIPPLTLLLNVQFDIVKIMTGEADLSLSLHGISFELGEVSLKMIDRAKFLDGGKVAVRWYPNFGLNAEAKVNFLSIFKGGMRISAAAGDGVKDFVEFMLFVSIGLPDFIPFVGGMELASAELGGGTEKIWGNITLLSIIQVGFIYRWGSKVEFTWGDPEGDVSLASASAKRSYALFHELTAPHQAGTDPDTGEPMYMSVGSNLSFAAGSEVVPDFDKLLTAKQGGAGNSAAQTTVTKVASTPDLDRHLVTFGDSESYFITISPKNGSKKLTTEDYKKILSVQKNGSPYGLKFYEAPSAGIEATPEAKQNALNGANVNVANGIAYLMIPATDVKTDDQFLLSMADKQAYDVAAILVNPISELTRQSASLSGHTLTVNWAGKNLSDTAEILVYASAGDDEGVVLNTDEIKANTPGGTASIRLPENMAGGQYKITLALSDEDKSFIRYDAGTVTLTDSKAPAAPLGVALTNAGNHKLKVSVTPPAGEFDGYFVDVFETDAEGNTSLADAALFFEKGKEILVGGEYVMPVMDEAGNPVTGPDGQPMSRVVGYTPGKTYSVEVRAGNVEDSTPDVPGDEVFHCSPVVASAPAVLKDATPPTVQASYDKDTGTVVLTADVPVSGELYVDGNLDEGKFYPFKNTASFSQKLDLPDGEHTLEIHAKDAEGDSSIATEILSVDTTAPVVLLESPINGSTFRGKSIRITGTAEDDATYIFRVNGKEVLRGSDMVRTGRLDCTLDVPEGIAAVQLEIEAVDQAGNSATQQVRLTSSELAEIREITLLCDGQPIPSNGKLLRKSGEQIELTLLGKLPSGGTVDLTHDPAVSFSLVGGSGAAVKSNTVTVIGGGDSLVMAAVDLGGGQLLSDGVILQAEDRFSQLRSAISLANAFTDPTLYPESSWTALQTALKNAEALLKNPQASDQEILNAVNALNAAIGNMAERTGLKVTATSLIVELPGENIHTVITAGYDARGRMSFAAITPASDAVNGVLTIQDSRYHEEAKVRAFYLGSDFRPVNKADGTK